MTFEGGGAMGGDPHSLTGQATAWNRARKTGTNVFRAGDETINCSLILRGLVAVFLLLVSSSFALQSAAYLTGHHRMYGLIALFDLEGEQTVPAAFSVLLLLVAALLLAAITFLEKQNTNRPLSHWALLAFGFLLMAGDEAWSFHERWSRPVRKILGDENLGIFYFSWVLPGMILVLLLAFVFSTFLRRLPSKTRHAFLAAALIYLGGAIGIELINGWYFEFHSDGGSGIAPFTSTRFGYMALVALEEAMEMAGVLAFIRALLAYLAEEHGEVRLRFG